MKKKSVVCSLFVFIIISVFAINYKTIRQNKFVGDDYDLQMIGVNDITIDTEKYVVTGDDAYLVYDLGEAKSLFNGKVYLNAVTEKGVTIQVFYAENVDRFSQEQSYYASIGKGENYLILSMPNKNVRFVRIDICSAVNSSIPLIERVTVAEKNFECIWNIFFSGYNIIRTMIVILAVCVLYRQRKLIYEATELHPYISVFAAIFVCTTILYWDYIVGEVYHIFYDIGSDSLYQTYPGLLYLARRIQEGEWGSGFSFTTGLGNPTGAIVIGLSNWVALFGEENVAYLMGISQWLKVSLSGCFAYIFSRCYGNKHKESFIVALCYAFNAGIIIRGAWTNYPNEALLIIIWLTAYEYYHQKKNAVFFPIATMLLFYHQSTYQSVLWGVLLVVYIAFRIISEQKISKQVIIRLCKIEMLYMGIVLVMVWDTLSSKLNATLSSERFLAGVNTVEKVSVFSLEDIMTSFARTIGMAINGISEEFVGTNNFLEAPAFYCGILVFLMIPVAIYNMQRWKRNTYLFGYLAVLIYMCVPVIRYVANGFSAETYKLSSFWIIILMVLTVMDGLKTLSSASKDVLAKSRWIFNITVLVTGVGLIELLATGYVTRLDNWLVSVGFVIVYTIVVNVILAGSFKCELMKTVICVCVMLEVCVVSWDVVNDRVVVTKAQMEEGAFYNGSSLEAINYLKENDSEWYRVDKKSGQVFLCDALAQDYYGTTSYVGGIGIGASISNFYQVLGLPCEVRYMYGSGGNIGIDALLGVKYFLNTSGKPMDVYGTTYLTTIGDTDIYRNDLALPIAYLYEDMISYEEFLGYSTEERRNILLQACALEGISTSEQDCHDTRELIKATVKEEEGKYYLELPEGSVLIVKVMTNNNTFSTLYCQNKDGDISQRYFDLMNGEETVIEIYMEELSSVWFASMDSVENVEFYYWNADEYYENVLESIDVLKENALKVEQFSERYIKGTISCDNTSMLATSIPYDSNWKMYVDGEEKETQCVNVGFVGAELEQGEHVVELYYETTGWMSDNIFRVVESVIVLLVTIYIVICQRKRVVNEEV